MRWTALLVALGMLTPCASAAQLAVLVGGAAAIPVGDFASVADLGYQGQVGVTVDLAATRFAAAMIGVYGRNGHEIEGERSVLYGATVLLGYTIAEARGVRFRGWVGLGGLVHEHKSDTFPGLDASRRGLSVSAGGTAMRPVGRVSVFVAGLYTRGLGALGTSRYPTELITLGGGVVIPLGID